MSERAEGTRHQGVEWLLGANHDHVGNLDDKSREGDEDQAVEDSELWVSLLVVLIVQSDKGVFESWDNCFGIIDGSIHVALNCFHCINKDKIL